MRVKYPSYQLRETVAVEAFKIAKVERVGKGAVIIPEDASLTNWCVTPEYVREHDPQPGGYWVRDEYGRQLYFAAEAFDARYSPVRG